MAEPGQRRRNLRWAVSIAVLLVLIDFFLSRPLEGLWDSLQERNSPAYLPLEWWMSAPFTLFMFAILSAILTSFSGLRNWFKAFLLLCGFKLIFAAASATSLHFRVDIGPAEAALRAMALSLPFVLVHIVLSSLAVMFFGDSFAEGAAGEVLVTPYFAGAELEEPLDVETASSRLETKRQDAASTPEPEGPFVPLRGGMLPVEEEAAVRTLELPVSVVLKSFPKVEVAMSPPLIEEISPSVRIPFDAVLAGLSEGRVEVEALTLISDMPKEAFSHPPEEVARQFPDGKLELPLREIVPRVPPDTFEPPQQKSQPDVDKEFADFFQEPGAPVLEEVAKIATLVRETEVALAPEEIPLEGGIEVEAAPLKQAVSAQPAALSEEALVLTEDERLLLERSGDVIELSVESVISQLPEGAVPQWEGPEARTGPQDAAVEEAPGAPRPGVVVVPLELIMPQLASGEARVQAKYFLAQFPEGVLSLSWEDIIGSLPNGEVALPLREIVPQLPPEVFAPPEQVQQPTLEDTADLFREVERAQPLVEEVTLPVGEEEVPVSATPPLAVSERAEPSLEERVPEEVTPAPAAVAAPKEEPAGVSYAEMLREENPLTLSVDTVVGLLPKGSFRVSAEELIDGLGEDTVKVPERMVSGQLKEGRVEVPVEILTVQFPPEQLGMSVEQIKTRVSEGMVELPLPEIVGQVLEEIAKPPESQRLQPECGEISTLFSEIPQAEPRRGGAQEQPVAPEAEVEAVAPEAETEAVVGPTPVEEGIARKEPRRGGAEKGETMLQGLLQECGGLGLSEHGWFTAEDSSVIVLAPSSLNREALGCGIIEIMGQMRGFCKDYGLGEFSKLVISCGRGAVVCRELVRGEAGRLILLASLHRSGAGVMSLLLDRFDPQLRDLSSLIGRGLEMGGGTCPAKSDSGFRISDLRLRNLQAASHAEAWEEVCEEVVAGLAAVGTEHYLSAEIASGEKLLVVWGGEPPVNWDFGFRTSDFGFQGPQSAIGNSQSRGHPLDEGIFDMELLSRYCSEVELGTFESLLLVTEEAKVTLDRAKAEGGVYLLGFFSGSHGEGLVRAKARKAVSLLEE